MSADADTMQTFVPGDSPKRPHPDEMQTVVPGGETVAAGTVAGAGADQDPILTKLQALSAAGTIDFDQITRLGEGGMGLVCKAHQISLDRWVALKVLKEELAKNEQLVERFIREARAMAKINHANVVQGYAVGEADGLHWVAMELIKGESMQDVLDRTGPLSIADASLVTLVAAEALQHAHELKMIHRDIKPDNILVTTDGQIKVADLGLAKATDEDMSMTQSGTGLGTPHYMPPEQARNAKHVDSRSDIYALGCTMYHFLTGGVPFAGESVVELIMNKEKGSFPPIRKSRSEVPERLALTVEKMMAIKPEHRHATMEQVIADITKLGAAGDTLGFIPDATPVRRIGNAPTIANSMPAPPATVGKPMAAKRVEAIAKKKPKKPATGEAKVWYLQIPGKDGNTRKVKAPHGEVLAKLRSGKLDPAKCRVAANPKGPYLTMAQVPAFSKELEKRGREKTNNARSKGLAAEMKTINKQYGRRKFYNAIRRLRDGTLGLLGLILYLGAFVVVGFLGYSYWDEIVAMISGGDSSAPAATAPAEPGENAAPSATAN